MILPEYKGLLIRSMRDWFADIKTDNIAHMIVDRICLRNKLFEHCICVQFFNKQKKLSHS
ncbi:hypothetical protein D068_cds01450 [Bacillus atrophaeus UCMB-5137]|nr:hypothetical protein D068_cds01450 [Bacillus atrophaeus UCMB-5137]